MPPTDRPAVLFFLQLLDQPPITEEDMAAAHSAVEEWVSALGAASRVEEADLLQDCLAKVLVHLTLADAPSEAVMALPREDLP